MKDLKTIIEALLSKKVSKIIEIDTSEFLSDVRQEVADKLLNAISPHEDFKEERVFQFITDLVDELVAELFIPENIKKGQATITLAVQESKDEEEYTRENIPLFKKINTIWKKEGLAYIGYNSRHQKLTITLL